jgi:hypothetical protein
MAQGELTEANNILRSLHIGIRHLDIWHESGPLWSALAFMQGQSREGIRRWRMVCAAPTGNILPFIFDRLAPDTLESTVRVAAPHPVKSGPSDLNPKLMNGFIKGALNSFLNEGRVDDAGELIEHVANDPDWKDLCPVELWRARFIDYLVEKNDKDALERWVKRLSPEIMQAGDMTLDGWFDFMRTYSERLTPTGSNGENS